MITAAFLTVRTSEQTTLPAYSNRFRTDLLVIAIIARVVCFCAFGKGTLVTAENATSHIGGKGGGFAKQCEEFVLGQGAGCVFRKHAGFELDRDIRAASGRIHGKQDVGVGDKQSRHIGFII